MQSQTHIFIINGSPMPYLQAGSGKPQNPRTLTISIADLPDKVGVLCQS